MKRRTMIPIVAGILMIQGCGDRTNDKDNQESQAAAVEPGVPAPEEADEMILQLADQFIENWRRQQPQTH